MANDNNADRAGSDREPEAELSCAFQQATDLVARFTRLGLEAGAMPLAWLPEETRGRLRQNAAEALHGLAIAPRVLSGLLDEVAREVTVPLEETDLGTRRREEARAAGTPSKESSDEEEPP